jgi:serine carboxypeptidase-like clade 1
MSSILQRSLLSFLCLFLLAESSFADTIRKKKNNINNDNDTKEKDNESCMLQSDHPDRMKSIPGWDQPLTSAWYSGYLDYEIEGQTVHTHYVLIQAEEEGEEDENENENDQHEEKDDLPLIYWSNGGPGASSLFGLLTEIGPLMLSDESIKTEEYKKTGIPTPIYNKYTWTRLGSILMIDQPAPVGFSYCNDDDTKNASSHSCGGIAWTDELTSLNAYTALQTFYKTKFPCLVEKELYLTGESYGGIYIPTLARQIVENNNKTDTNNDTIALNLKGFAVGDGCLGTETSMCGSLGTQAFVDYWYLWFMAGHHQIPLSDFRMIMKACSHSDGPGFLTTFGNGISHNKDDICRAALSKIKEEIGGLFEYALYDECTYQNGLKWKKTLGLDHNYLDHLSLDGALNDYPCGAGPVLEEYLSLGSVVLDAFHVRSTFFEVDNAEGDFDYTPTEPDLQPFYKEINGKLKILIYNGDTDPAITSFATQNWTSHLGFDEISHWRPWTIDGCQQMGGYVEQYEGNFDFLTIRGAGHMVPTYKPAASFAFLKAWLQDEEYPIFDKNCTQPPLSLSSSYGNDESTGTTMTDAVVAETY